VPEQSGGDGGDAEQQQRLRSLVADRRAHLAGADAVDRAEDRVRGQAGLVVAQVDVQLVPVPGAHLRGAGEAQRRPTAVSEKRCEARARPTPAISTSTNGWVAGQSWPGAPPDSVRMPTGPSPGCR